MEFNRAKQAASAELKVSPINELPAYATPMVVFKTGASKNPLVPGTKQRTGIAKIFGLDSIIVMSFELLTLLSAHTQIDGGAFALSLLNQHAMVVISGALTKH
jgi:hypothetical protein